MRWLLVFVVLRLDIEDAPLFEFLCLECKEALATKAETLMKLINDAVAQDNRDHMRDANRRYQRIADKLVEEPTSSEELGALKEFAEEATTLARTPRVRVPGRDLPAAKVPPSPRPQIVQGGHAALFRDVQLAGRHVVVPEAVRRPPERQDEPPEGRRGGQERRLG